MNGDSKVYQTAGQNIRKFEKLINFKTLTITYERGLKNLPNESAGQYIGKLENL